MSRIEEFFEKSVDAGIIPQIPMNYDAVSYKIYTGYLENKIDELTAEVAELRARLEKAVELPRVECIKTWEWLNRERLGDIMFEWCVLYKKDGGLVVEPCLSKEAAEARLKEIQGGER